MNKGKRQITDWETFATSKSNNGLIPRKHKELELLQVEKINIKLGKVFEQAIFGIGNQNGLEIYPIEKLKLIN